MDIYTLSRMFIQTNSQQVIVVAGLSHIKDYAEFMTYLGSRPLLEHPFQGINKGA